MSRELSAMVARSPFGQGATWPVVETVQRNGQCAVVIAPAPDLVEDLAAEAGTLALRHRGARCGRVDGGRTLRDRPTGNLLVNELAMRPHNSGHWGMDGARTGQFEQHLRAVLDYPLGDTTPLAPVTVMANILGAPEAPEMSMDERLHHLFARMPEAKVHLYGKGERQDRKIGHVNILGATVSSTTRLMSPRCGRTPNVRRTGCRTRYGPTDGMHERPATLRAVGLIMGSDSDWPTMEAAAEALAEFGIRFEVGVVSAHRTPQRMLDYARDAAGRGIEVIIAGAGGAAHLPGMVASATPLPVIGVPVP